MATPKPSVVNIGTRRSPLALKQAEIVVASLQAAYPDVSFQVHGLSVAGDRDKTTPLPALGKGLWTSELEAQLVEGGLDMIVHSLKDMPTTLPAGCLLGAVTAREDPRDVVVFRDPAAHSRLTDLAPGSIVGTSSVRRAAQLRRRYPALEFRDVRGNIDTRLRKLDGTFEYPAGTPAQHYDCTILAAAGLLRMGFGPRIGQFLESSTEGGGLLHAVGQGALGIEVREDDESTRALLRAVEDTPTMLACFAERSLMRTLEGGCSVPIGVETAWVADSSDGEAGKKLRMRAVVVSLDGTESVETEGAEQVASLAQADLYGRRLAQDLVQKGAQSILDLINKDKPAGAGAAKLGDAEVSQAAGR